MDNLQPITRPTGQNLVSGLYCIPCWSLKRIFAIPSARFGIRTGGAGSETTSFSSLNHWKSHKSTRNVYVAIVPSTKLASYVIKHKNIVRIECWSRNGASGSGTASKSGRLDQKSVRKIEKIERKKTKFLISSLYCIPVASVIILLSLLISKTNFRNTQCSIWDQNRGCWIINYQFFINFKPNSLEIL